MSKLYTNQLLICALTVFLMTSCGLPKQTLQRVDSRERKMLDLPIDYCNLFPTLTFEQWDKDYEAFNKFLSANVRRTQMGLSYTINGVHTYWCVASARTHVQLDTATMIHDSKVVIGEWRIVCNRKITYEESASIADKKIYRSSRIDYDNKADDLVLIITQDKFKLFEKKKGNNNFKTVTNRNYHIENKRYLMLYKLSLAAAAISFVGLDKDGRLIVNAFYVQERKIKGTYIVYQATMTQLVFKKII